MTNSEAEGQGGAPVQGEDETPARRRIPRLPALRLRPNPGPDGIPWSDWLFWLFRAVAVLELAKGLFHWTVLLGGGAAFVDMPAAFRVATVYFAVLNPVAGIGMWLTSSWGAVLWLVAAASQAALCIVMPGVFGHLWPVAMIEIVAACCYVWFTLKVAAGQAEA